MKGGELSLSSACRYYHLIGCQGLAFEGGAAELEEEEVLVELGLGAELHWRTTAPQSEETSPTGRIPRLMHSGYKLKIEKGTLKGATFAGSKDLIEGNSSEIGGNLFHRATLHTLPDGRSNLKRRGEYENYENREVKKTTAEYSVQQLLGQCLKTESPRGASSPSN